MAQSKDAGDGPPSARTRKRHKVSVRAGSPTQGQLNASEPTTEQGSMGSGTGQSGAFVQGAHNPNDHLETLRSIDMRPMGDGNGDEEEKYVQQHREELLQNLKDNIILPLHEIEFHKIFTLQNCPLMINSEIIREVCDQAMKEIENAPKLQGRDRHISHLCKLIFVIPTIFSSIIRVSRPNSSDVDSRMLDTPSKASSIGKELSKVKYSATNISKEELDQMSLQMEGWICGIMDTKKTDELRRNLSKVLNLINYGDAYIECDSEETEFADETKSLIFSPIVKLFSFLCDKKFRFKAGKIKVNGDQRSGVIGTLVKPDIIMTNGTEDRSLVMLELKRPFLGFFPQGKNHVLVDDDRDKCITSKLIRYMTLSKQRFGLLTDLFTMTLVQLPIGESNLSEIYDGIDNCIQLGYTTIRTFLIEKSDQITEGAEVTSLNALEARTAIALVLYGNLEDKFFAAHYDTPLNELSAMIEDKSNRDRKKTAEKRATDKQNQRIGETFKTGEPKKKGDEGTENDLISKAYISPPSSATNNVDGEGVLLEVDTPEKWFSIFRSSGAGFHNCEILEITKLTFTSLFKPTKAELSVLSECKGPNLIMKCFNDDSAEHYYLNNEKDIQEYYCVRNAEEYLRDVIYDEYLWPEVNANLRVMEYNAAVKAKNPSAVINSPKIVKFGTIVDTRKNLFGPYIIFEALEKKDRLTYERIGQLTEEQKESIRAELNKFHSGAKMSHGDVAARNVFLDDEGVAHFIDLQRCRELTDDDPDYWIKEDKEACERIFSNESDY